MKLHLCLVLLISLLVGCSSTEKAAVPSAAQSEEASLEQVIADYFAAFEDIRVWRTYATDEFIRRSYVWCTGDSSNERSIDEMVHIYYEWNKDSLGMNDVQVEKQTNVNENEVWIDVKRTWADESWDYASYSLLKVNGKWKVDNRL